MTIRSGWKIAEVDATDVKIGDRIMVMLSDATAAVPVTSITEKVLDLTKYDLGKPVHLKFGWDKSANPWYVDERDMTANKDGKAFIGVRATPEDIHNEAVSLGLV